MALIKAFRGVRPIPEKAVQVASPPYDVLNSEEAAARASGNRYSFLHVTKPEIDLPRAIDPYDPRVYAKGAENLSGLIREGILIPDPEPCLYVYTLRMGSHEQTGLVALASLQEYDEDRIKKHEHTRPDKERDRMNHIKALHAQAEPVFLTYRADAAVDRLIREAVRKSPIYDFSGDYGIRHTLTVIDDSALVSLITEAFGRIDALYVADGHHRSAAAHTLWKEKRVQPGYTGSEPYAFFLSVLFPHREMQILDYNRVVRDLNGLSGDAFLERIAEAFDVHTCAPSGDSSRRCGEAEIRPARPQTFSMYISGRWYVLSLKNAPVSQDSIDALDVSILQNSLLSPILGIKDPRTDKRIDFVGGIRGLKELERLVDSGAFQVAFALYPTSIEQLLAVADSGRVMPPKSTWFEPKLYSGLFIHTLD